MTVPLASEYKPESVALVASMLEAALVVTEAVATALVVKDISEPSLSSLDEVDSLYSTM